MDDTVGLILDQRVLPDAPDCWIVGTSATSGTGRLARQDGGDASGDFQRARQEAEAGGYFAGDAGGVGDEAFCTGMSDARSFGILVRAGGNLAYVSLLDPAGGGGRCPPDGRERGDRLPGDVRPGRCGRAGDAARRPGAGRPDTIEGRPDGRPSRLRG